MSTAAPVIAVVIPAYHVARHLPDLIKRIPEIVGWIIVVDDCSKDDTAAVAIDLQRVDPRIELVRHVINQGVGGAMATGFETALKTPAKIIVKVDGDGQMAPERIAALVRPITEGRADFAKGNRFRHLESLRSMPAVRRLGNLGLSFAVKVGSGYWRSFDPTNGFIAIRREVLAAINLAALDKRYFFEISLLGQLSLLGAVVRDVSMPAIYGNETSHLRVKKIAMEFPRKLVAMTVRRVLYRKLSFDFTMDGLYLMLGIPSLIFGAIFGAIKWHKYAALSTPAPTGTIMIAVLACMAGIQFVTAALALDILSEPSEPIADGTLEPAVPEVSAPSSSARGVA